MKTVAGQVKSVPAAVRPIVRAAIEMVKAVAPRAEEIAYEMAPPKSKSMVWKLARYTVDGENVVGIGTLTAHSILYFYRGRELDDESGLLQGGGKEMRFIRLESPADVERPAVKRMVGKAFQLARGS
ncbi:MAG TPA: DUF1801 domain-containing protein [Candidatus Dormibacteraeota bacterium]